MTNTKLSKTAGYVSTAEDVGGISKPDWMYIHSFPLIDEEAWHPSEASGNSQHNAMSHSFETFDKSGNGWEGSGKGSDIVQISDTQFGVGMGCYHQDQNRIYYSALPFQVDAAGAITKGTASSQDNSSGKEFDGSQYHQVGFANTTSGSVQGIPANSNNVIWYGRQFWSDGSWYMMTWGARFNTSNTVATLDRTTNSDYNSNYPRPMNLDKVSRGNTYGWYEEDWDGSIEGSHDTTTHQSRYKEGWPSGNVVLSGGISQTPYYHIIGHDTNNYSYWSRWSYNSGSYPNHNTSTQLASSGTRASAGIPIAQYWDCGWDHLGGYYYHHTTRQFGFGLISSAGAQNTVSNDMLSMFPKQGVKDKCFVIPLRFASNIVIWLNYKTGEYYTNDGAANTMVESIGSPNQMTVIEKQKMQEVLPLFPSCDNGSYTEKPIRTPTTTGTISTLYTSSNWKGGIMIKKWTYNSTGKVLTVDYQYASPNTMNPGTIKFQRYRFAGANKNILVNATISDNSQLTVRTYDVSQMFTALGI